MAQCDSLLYLYTLSAAESRWMPWELGYFDALNGNVAIFPLARTHGEQPFKGTEFIGLYPWVDLAPMQGGTASELWINKSPSVYGRMKTWLLESNAALKRYG